MRKIIFSIILSVITVGICYGQVPKKIDIVSSALIKGLHENGSLRIIKPVFSHEGSTLAADSANLNQAKNTFDAFGNVVITQSDGTTIYSDLLNYNGNNKLALLTHNVRLINGDATLTTDFLTYNMATKVGTYTGGGKIVNGENVVVSKNGYYFANSRDAYFRYNVVLTSPKAIIKSDTLRYNSNSKIAYFYGPTHIYGQDSSVLYTENGTHNTLTEQSRFGKKNLYTQGSKSLKGDSLFYDSKAGYGRAIKNITFTDTAQKFTFKGDIGIYRKSDGSILATKNAYVIITTESDSKVDSIWMAADTLFSKVILTKDIQPFRKQELKKDTELDDPQAIAGNASESSENNPQEKRVSSRDSMSTENKSSEKLAQGLKKNTVLNNASAKNKPLSTSGKPLANPRTETNVVTTKESKPIITSTADDAQKKDVKSDSLTVKRVTKPLPLNPKVVADTLAKDTLIKKENLAQKKEIPNQGKSKRAIRRARKAALAASSKGSDTTKNKRITQKGIVGTDSLQKESLADTARIAKLKKLRQDSLLRSQDTSKTRIVFAYHKAKIFKSDLQAKADSMFFSYKDSIVRCYYNPITWAQQSQLTADTIYLQLKNKKLDNMLLQHKAFIVNTEADSSKIFNQVKGKVITGYFRNNKLDRMFVDGNAESLYYIKEDSAYTGMNHMISSRIKILFDKSQLQDIMSIRKPEGHFFPIDKIPKDRDILEGFVWKPKERPRSKEEIIHQQRQVQVSDKKLAKPAKAKASGKTEKKKQPEKSDIRTPVKATGTPDTSGINRRSSREIKSSPKTDTLDVKPTEVIKK